MQQTRKKKTRKEKKITGTEKKTRKLIDQRKHINKIKIKSIHTRFINILRQKKRLLRQRYVELIRKRK